MFNSQSLGFNIIINGSGDVKEVEVLQSVLSNIILMAGVKTGRQQLEEFSGERRYRMLIQFNGKREDAQIAMS